MADKWLLKLHITGLSEDQMVDLVTKVTELVDKASGAAFGGFLPDNKEESIDEPQTQLG